MISIKKYNKLCKQHKKILFEKLLFNKNPKQFDYCVKTLTGHNDSVYSVSIFHNDKYIVSGSSDKTIKRWDLKVKENYYNESLKPMLKKQLYFNLENYVVKDYYTINTT